MGVKRQHGSAEDEAEEAVAEPELTGFVQDGTLYLRDAGGCVYSSERNWRGELVAVGHWDGASAQLDQQEPAQTLGWGPLSTLRDPAEDKRRTEELTREIGGYAQRKQLQKATETYEQLAREGLKPTGYTYSNLLNAHINSGDVGGGHRVFNRMVAAGHRPNVIVYTTMLKGLCSVGELGEAMLLLQRMAHASPPVPADIRTLNTFLRGCVRAGRLAPARWAFNHLAEWGVRADHVAFTAFARLLAQALRLDETRELVSARREHRVAQLELRAAARRGEGPPPPRSVACSFWMEGRCERGVNCRFYHDPAIPQQGESQAAAEERDAEATQEVHIAHSAALLGRRATQTAKGGTLDSRSWPHP